MSLNNTKGKAQKAFTGAAYTSVRKILSVSQLCWYWVIFNGLIM